MKKIIFVLSLLFCLAVYTPIMAVQPTTMELLTLPFGTASYSSDMAMESLFKELKSPVSLQLKQTPGAMFMTRYSFENLSKMREGKVPFTLSLTTTTNMPYMAKGLPPYQDYPTPDARIVAIVNGIILPFITFDPDIKSPADFVGKKVGVAEKARPNQSTLPNQPVFDYAYGGYDKVSWQYLGFANSKDAILNNSIDVHMGNAFCTLETDENGNYFVSKAGVDPATMEVISAGKAFYIASEDPEILKKAYDPEKHIVHYPVLLKAGAIPGYDQDVWVKGAATCYSTDKDVPDEVVEEIVYQMFKNKERLATYYDGFSYLGNSPYLSGIDINLYHPGIFKAMKRLGLPLPDGIQID